MNINPQAVFKTVGIPPHIEAAIGKMMMADARSMRFARNSADDQSDEDKAAAQNTALNSLCDKLFPYLMAGWPMREIEKETGFSEVTITDIRREFKARYGMTVKDYSRVKNALRIANMMKNTDMPPKAIAFHLGVEVSTVHKRMAEIRAVGLDQFIAENKLPDEENEPCPART